MTPDGLPIVIEPADLPDAKPHESLLTADECHKRALWYLALERAKRKRDREVERARTDAKAKLDAEAAQLYTAGSWGGPLPQIDWEVVDPGIQDYYRRLARKAREIHGVVP